MNEMDDWLYDANTATYRNRWEKTLSYDSRLVTAAGLSDAPASVINDFLNQVALADWQKTKQS